MKTYTEYYDSGKTRTGTGECVSKDSMVMEVCGTIDELNTFIGLARSACKNPRVYQMLHEIQSDLMVMGADIAGFKIKSDKTRISEAHVKEMERMIVEIDTNLEPLRNFVYPSGSHSSSLLQVCRAVCRRAERKSVALKEEKLVNENILKYINRLSDLLFSLARLENKANNFPDEIW